MLQIQAWKEKGAGIELSVCLNQEADFLKESSGEGLVTEYDKVTLCSLSRHRVFLCDLFLTSLCDQILRTKHLSRLAMICISCSVLISYLGIVKERVKYRS